MILTMALDAELTFWLIKQLFYGTLCLDSSLHRCIKVTNVSNKEKHDESYLIQFCLKDLLYACADTPLRKSGRKHRHQGVANLCVSSQAWWFLMKHSPLHPLSSAAAATTCYPCIFLLASCSSQKIESEKPCLTSNLLTLSHAIAVWHSDEPDKHSDQFWAVNSHIFLIFINRYQWLPSSPPPTPSLYFLYIYIYAFCKGLKSMDAQGTQSFKKEKKKNHTLEPLANSSTMQVQLGKRLHQEIWKFAGKMLSGNLIFHFEML